MKSIMLRSPVESTGHMFAITFSYGHFYLDDTKTVADFGLKIAINALSDERIRSVERANIGASIRDFVQAAGQRDLRSFGFDDALDLIRKVSGRSADANFARNLTGARALRFSSEIEIADLADAAVKAVSFYNSKAYQKTAFKIIDFLSPVTDGSLIDRLDSELVRSVREREDDFEIAVPAIISEGIGTFRFERAGFSKFHPDLSLALYQDELGTELESLTLDKLKNHRVSAYAEEGERPVDAWSVYDALVGSLTLLGKRYAFSEGLWYSVDNAFKDAADQKFEDLRKTPDAKLLPLKKRYEGTGQKKKGFYQSEKSYNAEMSSKTGYLLLDCKLIQIDERPGAGIEACDLLDIKGRRFIHVKKSSRQSSVLSHFFKQGGNSARLVRKYPKFKQNLVAQVKKDYGAAKAEELNAALDAGGKWTVEFQIADFPRQDGKHNIPFFSKLSLRDEAMDLEAMGFRVAVRFITLSRAV